MMRQKPALRSGSATVEMAVLLPLILGLLCGIWVVGRLVEVHLSLDNACREASRIAAQGQIITLTGAYTEVYDTDADPDTPDCKTQVLNALFAAGIDITDDAGTVNVIVEFDNLTDASRDQPHSALKGDRLRLTVKLPQANIRLPVPTRLPGFFLPDPDYLISITEFQSVQDDPFVVNTTLPAWQNFTN